MNLEMDVHNEETEEGYEDETKLYIYLYDTLNEGKD